MCGNDDEHDGHRAVKNRIQEDTRFRSFFETPFSACVSGASGSVSQWGLPTSRGARHSYTLNPKSLHPTFQALILNPKPPTMVPQFRETIKTLNSIHLYKNPKLYISLYTQKSTPLPTLTGGGPPARRFAVLKAPSRSAPRPGSRRSSSV